MFDFNVNSELPDDPAERAAFLDAMNKRWLARQLDRNPPTLPDNPLERQPGEVWDKKKLGFKLVLLPWARKGEKADGKPWNVSDPMDFYPVWGETQAERFDSWREISSLHSPDRIQPGAAIKTIRDNGKEQIVVALWSTGKCDGVFEIELRIQCCGCGGWFEITTGFLFRSVPELCKDCTPKITAEDFSDKLLLPAHKSKPSPVKDAVLAMIERFREYGDTALVSDIVAGAAAALPKPKGKDVRKQHAKQALDRLSEVTIEGDTVILKQGT